jgi:predicted oxidoreductase
MVSGFDTHDLVQRVCSTPEGYTWQVMNRRIALTELAASGAEWNPALRDRRILRFAIDMLTGSRGLVSDLTANCPDIVVAATVEELAAKMSLLTPDVPVDVALLKSELEAFDATAVTGSDDDQRQMIERLRSYRADKMRLARIQRILDPGAGPLIAIRERIVTRKSLGGVVTDLRSRALNASDQPVPGLFAIGEAAGFGGGGSHGWRALEGTFLLSCIITARRAAEAIGRG